MNNSWLSWRGVTLTASAVLLLGATVGDPAARRAEEALRLYEKGQFEAALQLYREAQVEKPGSPELHFNLGDVLFRLGDAENALREFELAAAAPELRAPALYNMGTVYLTQHRLDEAVEAYRAALRADDADDDARANLELALQLLDQQQEQPQPQPQQQQQQQQDANGQDAEEDGEPGPDGAAAPQTGRDQQQPDSGHEPPPEAPDDDNLEAPRDGHAEPPVPETRQGIDREDVEKLLDALIDRDRQAQRHRWRPGRGDGGKDW